jgi:hypothetical protein
MYPAAGILLLKIPVTLVAGPLWHPEVAQVFPPSPGDPDLPSLGAPVGNECSPWKLSIPVIKVAIISKFFLFIRASCINIYV